MPQAKARRGARFLKLERHQRVERAAAPGQHEARWRVDQLHLPLFAAATAREQRLVPEVSEPAVRLRPMGAGMNSITARRRPIRAAWRPRG